MTTREKIVSPGRQVSDSLPRLTAVFIGATSGIGKASLEAMVAQLPEPNIYVIGRSKDSYNPGLEHLKALNNTANITFVEGQIALIHDVDRVCAEISRHERHLDLLFMSPGALGFGGPHCTTEGLDICFSLSVYARMRFIEKLMPLLLAAKYPRIHSVLAGGHERSWFTKDLDLGLQKHDGRNYTVLRAINQVTTMHTLAFFHLASKHPQVAFMHVYPGWVDTGYHFTLLGSLGLAGTALAHVLDPIRRCIAISCEESGRQQAHYATSTRFPSRAMIQRAQYNVEDVAKSHARCSGVYLLLEDGRSVTETQFIKQLEVEGWPEKTWAFIQDVFASISGI